MDGAGGEQQCRDICGLPGPVAPQARGTAERDLGQRAGAPWRSDAGQEYPRTPGLELRLVNLPGYSPDFNADEAVWGWAREEATGNPCLGSKAQCRRGSIASSPGWTAGKRR